MKSQKNKSLICCLLLCSMLLGLCACAGSQVAEKAKEMVSSPTNTTTQKVAEKAKKISFKPTTITVGSGVKLNVKSISEQNKRLEFSCEIKNSSTQNLIVRMDHVTIGGVGLKTFLYEHVPSDATSSCVFYVELATLAYAKISSFNDLTLHMEVKDDKAETLFQSVKELDIGSDVQVPVISTVDYKLLSIDEADLKLVGVQIDEISQEDNGRIYIRLFLHGKANFPREHEFTSDADQRLLISQGADGQAMVDDKPATATCSFYVDNNGEFVDDVYISADSVLGSDNAVTVELPLMGEEGVNAIFSGTIWLKLQGDGTVLAWETKLVGSDKNSAQIVTSESLTLSGAEAGKLVLCNNAPGNDIVITVPDHDSAPLPIGTEIQVLRYYNGNVTVQGDKDVHLYYPGRTGEHNDTVNPFKIQYRYGLVTLRKIYKNRWVVSGDIG